MFHEQEPLRNESWHVAMLRGEIEKRDELLREALEILQAPQDYAYEQMYELAGKIEEAIE